MKKILVYLEAQKNTLKRSSLEAISAARNLSKEMNIPFAAAIINGTEENLQIAKEYGLNDVFNMQSNLLEKYSCSGYAAALSNIAKEKGFGIVLIPANIAGLEIAPRIAIRLQAGYIADCIALEIQNGEIIAKKPIYAGKAQVSAKIDTENKVFTLRPNVFTASKEEASVLNIIPYAANLTEKELGAIVTSTMKNEGKLDVAEADIIVTGGRGMKGPENFHLVEELSATLGAAVGASRAVVDAGWRPHSEQVGQTGKTVSPTLYVACGISGAIQHLAGMSSAKYIVAINKDKDAPIFKVTDYGIVGDAIAVLPKLNENIKKIKG
ncbi:MAG: electron transfer flavoprotein subunit alpha/FixB family protein [Ignavibacteria bacterium]|nr:electron transfer flavoprotein subunit alpha/FixB family protein [Ignavibacteria bacterium]